MPVVHLVCWGPPLYQKIKGSSMHVECRWIVGRGVGNVCNISLQRFMAAQQQPRRFGFYWFQNNNKKKTELLTGNSTVWVF